MNDPAKLPVQKTPKAITLPAWFPELDVIATIRPLCELHTASMCRRYDCRWFIITSFRVRLFCWRSTWLIDFGFNLYKREQR